MGLPLLDCLRRGVANLAANWPLIGLVVARQIVTGVFVLAGFVPLVVAVAGSALAPMFAADDLDSALAQLPWAGGWSELWLPLLAGAAAATVIWTVAFLIFCYFQGGLYGLLAAGEESAGRPAGGSPREAFAVFSLGRFDRFGRRLVWRYFWLLNLFAVVFSVGLLVALGALALVVPGLQRSIESGAAVSAALAVAAAGIVVVAAGLSGVALSIWVAVAQAVAAVGDPTVGEICRRSLALLRRRLAAVLGALVIAWLASLVASSVAMPVWLVAAAALRGDAWTLFVGLHLGFMAVQWVLAAAVYAWRSAVLVSLGRDAAAEAGA